jgi:hypothetical protein
MTTSSCFGMPHKNAGVPSGSRATPTETHLHPRRPRPRQQADRSERCGLDDPEKPDRARLAAYGYPVRAARIANRFRIRSTSAIPAIPLVTMNSIGVRRENGAAWILRCSHA